MELIKTQQVNRYIAAQGPMQHTCRDFWQVRDNKLRMAAHLSGCLGIGLCIHEQVMYSPYTDGLGAREYSDHYVDTYN